MLEPLVNGWLAKIKRAEELKRDEFGKQAEECMKFFCGPYTAMYGSRRSPGNTDDDFNLDGGADEIPAPSFRVSINKAAEVVQLFGPVMYQRNPDRKVTPRHVWAPPPEMFGSAQDPMAQQQAIAFKMQADLARSQDLARAQLLQQYLNETPTENKLHEESRMVVDEALIKGMGCWWTEKVELPTGKRIIGSFHDSVDNLVLDPDAKKRSDVMWVARRCSHPVWEVEREYNLPPGSVKGNAESANRLAATAGNGDEDYKRLQGVTNDILVYYKVYSKMGIGGRMKGVLDHNATWKEELDETFGDHCFIVVAPGVPHPLNLPPQLIEQGDPEALQQATDWPVPFWLFNEWPVTTLEFHRVPNRLWPMSHLTPGIGELKFLNWIYSMLANKIRICSRDFFAILKSASNELKETIKHGPDYSVIEVESTQSEIDKVVKFLQHPDFNPEIYKVADRMMELFEKRTGLTDLVYGETTQQMRSAEEARVKNSATSVRPEDMAQQVEDAASALARKEMAAARWLLTAEDVQPILGPMGAYFWQQLVTTSDPAEVFSQYEARIEQGTTRRPDKNRDVSNYKDAMQVLGPILQQYMMASGDTGPLNALIAGWGQSIDLDNTEKFLLSPPAPPPVVGPPGSPAPGGSPSTGAGAGAGRGGPPGK
jgi:hypothetical protein